MTEYIDRRELVHLSRSPVSLSARLSYGLSRILGTLGQWHQRSRQRRRLGTLDDRLLSDIGVDRASARFEADKPFWES
jgi:uncharacterized protein YjiS (DUF1127 family)